MKSTDQKMRKRYCACCGRKHVAPDKTQINRTPSYCTSECFYECHKSKFDPMECRGWHPDALANDCAAAILSSARKGLPTHAEKDADPNMGSSEDENDCNNDEF